MSDATARLAAEIRKHLQQFEVPVEPPAVCYWHDGSEGDIADIVAYWLTEAGWVWRRPIVNRQCPAEISTPGDDHETVLHCTRIEDHSGEHEYGSSTIVIRKVEGEA